MTDARHDDAAIIARLRCRAVGVILLSFALLRCGERERPPLNVILITLDTTRADHLGCYGSRAGATPAIDRLAARGVRFEQADSVVPLTLPSHATLLTGLLPQRHGLRVNGGGTLRGSVETLATVFSRRGFRTGAFVGSFVLDHRFGLGRGFGVYDDAVTIDPQGASESLDAERPAGAVADAALGWLRETAPRPFFAWIHFYDAHAPSRRRSRIVRDSRARRTTERSRTSIVRLRESSTSSIAQIFAITPSSRSRGSRRRTRRARRIDAWTVAVRIDLARSVDHRRAIASPARRARIGEHDGHRPDGCIARRCSDERRASRRPRPVGKSRPRSRTCAARRLRRDAVSAHIRMERPRRCSTRRQEADLRETRRAVRPRPRSA